MATISPYPVAVEAAREGAYFPPRRAMRMPWRGAWSPHAVLDVTGACDISCPGCYNARPARARTFEEIAGDLERLLALRRLHTVTLSGGEPTRHPELESIVRHVKSRGLRAALLTNGAALDDALGERLARAGLDVAFLHVQAGQRRPDLPGDATPAQVQELRARKAATLARHGIAAALSVIAYPGRLDEVDAAVAAVLSSPHLHYMIITGYTDFSRFTGVRGDLRTGLFCHGDAIAGEGRQGEGPQVTCGDIAPRFSRIGLEPCAYVGSSADAGDPRWLLYLVAVARRADGGARVACLPPGLLGPLLLRAVRRLRGRFPFFHPASGRALRARLLLSALSGGKAAARLRLALLPGPPGTRLHDKHIVFQQGPRIEPGGAIVHCSDCPDATVRGDALVPLCLADRCAVSARSPGEPA